MDRNHHVIAAAMTTTPPTVVAAEAVLDAARALAAKVDAEQPPGLHGLTVKNMATAHAASVEFATRHAADVQRVAEIARNAQAELDAAAKMMPSRRQQAGGADKPAAAPKPIVSAQK